MAKGITLAQAIQVFQREIGCSGSISDDRRDILLNAIHEGIEFMLLNGGGNILREWIVTVKSGRFTFPRDLETPVKYKIGCSLGSNPVRAGFGPIESVFFPYSSQSVSNCCGFSDWSSLKISLNPNKVVTQYCPPAQGVQLMVTTRDDRDVGKKVMVNGRKCKKDLFPTHNNIKTSGELLTIYKECDPHKKYSAWVFDEITGIVKDLTCSYVMLSGIDTSTGEQVFLSHYTPDEEVPQYTEGFIHSCSMDCCTRFELHILGRIAPYINYYRNEEILPISSIGILNLLAKRARLDAGGDAKKLAIIEQRIKDLIDQQVKYQEASNEHMSFNLASSGGSLATI